MRLRTRLLAAAGLAAATLAATVAALIGSGRSAPRADMGPAAVPMPPPAAPERASRALRRVPVRAVRQRVTRKITRRTSRTRILATGSCQASFYGTGTSTASGAAYDPEALTAAHPSLPMGSRVRVINLSNARSVIVRVNDRGPFVPGRCLDLSTAAMRAVGGMLSGVIPVRYQVLASV